MQNEPTITVKREWVREYGRGYACEGCIEVETYTLAYRDGSVITDDRLDSHHQQIFERQEHERAAIQQREAA